MSAASFGEQIMRPTATQYIRLEITVDSDQLWGAITGMFNDIVAQPTFLAQAHHAVLLTRAVRTSQIHTTHECQMAPPIDVALKPESALPNEKGLRQGVNIVIGKHRRAGSLSPIELVSEGDTIEFGRLQVRCLGNLPFASDLNSNLSHKLDEGGAIAQLNLTRFVTTKPFMGTLKLRQKIY